MRRNNEKLVEEKPVIFRELVREIPSTTYGTFALYRYPAKFIPQVIAYALKTYGKPGMSVFDPFAGYGTVGPVARLYGNHYELWDLNPLLGYFHAVTIMKPVGLVPSTLVQRMAAHKKTFTPDWPNVTYWFPEQFLPMISKAWDFYHSLDDEVAKQILLIPLIKATRYFSYNDERRQKLSRSFVAKARVDTLLAQNWTNLFFKMIFDGVRNILKRIQEYWDIGPKTVKAKVRAGVDTFSLDLENEHDLLITSPPYLQAQEYIRASKIDLFWLGYSETMIKELGKKEIPYRDIPSCPIYSATYRAYHEQITEAHLRRLYENYFFGVLGALTRLQRKISNRLLLFVGPATIRAKTIPIDRIFAEHFVELGWRHEITLIDTIVARSMFFYRKNPATNLHDKRMTTEHLVVLSRR
jgi:DNA modification methylase